MSAALFNCVQEGFRRDATHPKGMKRTDFGARVPRNALILPSSSCMSPIHELGLAAIPTAMTLARLRHAPSAASSIHRELATRIPSTARAKSTGDAWIAISPANQREHSRYASKLHLPALLNCAAPVRSRTSLRPQELAPPYRSAATRHFWHSRPKVRHPSFCHEDDAGLNLPGR